MKNKLRLSLCADLLAVVLPAVPGASVPRASASPTEKGLSYSGDGQTYSQNPPPLFEDESTLVPGDEITRSLWVRNDRPTGIEVTVQPIEPETSTRMSFETVNASVVRLQPAQSKKFDLKIGLPWSADKLAEDRQERALQIRIDAVETYDSDEPPSQAPRDQSPQGADPEEKDELADTGFSSLWLLMALGSLVAGSIALGASRKRNQRIAQGREAKHER